LNLIGIDPGTTTGFAVCDSKTQQIIIVQSLSIHRALYEVKSIAGRTSETTFVVFEDARMRKWFGNAGREKLQGVGSVKRDCSIWEDFLEDEGIPYRANRPIEHGTKWTSEYFKRATGWQARTSEHGRDAAVLVWGINEPMAQGWLRTWQQARTRAKASAHT